MSYEYKEILKVAARDFLAGNLEQDSETGEYLNLGEVEENYSDISIKIDHIYRQAAKADEYEAKANAWDAMKKDFEDIADTPMGQQILFTMSTIKERVESGERDA